MKTTTMMQTAAAALTLAAVTRAPNVSAAAFVDAQTASPLWNRVYTNAVTLEWRWDWDWVPYNADKARVTLTGGVFRADSGILSGSVSNYTFTLFTQMPNPFAEDSMKATLTFLNSSGAVLTSRVSRLDILQGSFAPVRVLSCETNTLKWLHSSKDELIVYDPSWLENTNTVESMRLVYTAANHSFLCSTQSVTEATGLFVWPYQGCKKTLWKLDLFCDSGTNAVASAFVNRVTLGTVIMLF